MGNITENLNLGKCVLSPCFLRISNHLHAEIFLKRFLGRLFGFLAIKNGCCCPLGISYIERKILAFRTKTRNGISDMYIITV